MAHPEDSSASEAKPESAQSESAATPATGSSSEQQASADTPKVDPPGIEPEAAPHRISYLQPYRPKSYSADADATIPPEIDAATAHGSLWAQVPRHLPLAACLVVATALGALAGVAATGALKSEQPPPAAVAANTTALHDSLARLQGELSTLRSGIAASQRSTGSQIGKLTERIDRAEKAQAEPTAKLAKITESVERLERRVPQHQAAAQPVGPQLAAAQPVAGAVPSGDITGSVAGKPDVKAPESKLTVVEGWRMVDVYGNHAVVENRNGRLFNVVVGSTLPTLGRVDSIARDEVVTRNGIIAAAESAPPPRRRRPYFYPD